MLISLTSHIRLNDVVLLISVWYVLPIEISRNCSYRHSNLYSQCPYTVIARLYWKFSFSLGLWTRFNEFSRILQKLSKLYKTKPSFGIFFKLFNFSHFEKHTLTDDPSIRSFSLWQTATVLWILTFLFYFDRTHRNRWFSNKIAANYPLLPHKALQFAVTERTKHIVWEVFCVKRRYIKKKCSNSYL